MNFTPLPIAEEDLHGFVDGEVNDDKREAILAYLATAPADAARVEAWRQQNILLRAAFSQVALEQVPMSLSFTFAPRLITLPSFVPAGGAARQTYSRRLQQRSLVFTLAAFVAGVCITLAANVWLTRYAANFTRLPAASLPAASLPAASHGPALALLATSALHPSPRATNLPQALLNLPGAVEPALVILPVLKAEGLQLLRGEVRGEPGEPANCLDFADAAGTPVVLCIAAAKLPATTEFQSLATVSANSVYWRESTSLYALAAPLENARLVALARRIHAGLAARQAP
ncbi:MAG: hypothetical protein WCF20_00485 [Methylovirgula sp.]